MERKSLLEITSEYLINHLPVSILDDVLKYIVTQSIKYDIVLYPKLISFQDFIYPCMEEEVFIPEIEVVKETLSFLTQYYAEFDLNDDQLIYFNTIKDQIMNFSNNIRTFQDLIQFLHENMCDEPDYWNLYTIVRANTIHNYAFGFDFEKNAKLISFIETHDYAKYFEIIEIEKYAYVVIENNSNILKYRTDKKIENIKFDINLMTAFSHILKIYKII